MVACVLMSRCVLIAFICLSMFPSVCCDTETQRHKSKEAHQHKTKGKRPQRHRDTQAHTNTDIDITTKTHTHRHTETRSNQSGGFATCGPTNPTSAPCGPSQTSTERSHADLACRQPRKGNCKTQLRDQTKAQQHNTKAHHRDNNTGTKQKPKGKHTHTHTHTQQNKDTETQKHRDTKTQRHRNTQGCNSSRFCAWWGGGQSKVSFVIQNGTLHNIFSGAAIQADSVHGGVVDNQKQALSYRIAFFIIDPVGRQFKPILCMVGWWTIKGRPCHTEWHST